MEALNSQPFELQLETNVAPKVIEAYSRQAKSKKPLVLDPLLACTKQMSKVTISFAYIPKI